MRLRSKRAPAPDPETGIVAAGVSFRRHAGGNGYRLCLVDDAGAVVASFDADRGDMHDMRHAIGDVLRIKAGA